MNLKNWKLASIIAAGLLASTTACSSATQSGAAYAPGECKDTASPGVTANTIRLGTTLPISGSAATTSANLRKGQEAAMKFINDDGGIHGRNLTGIFLDDQYLPAKAQANVRQLVQQDDVLMLVGGSGTASTLAWAPTLNQLKVPAIGPYAGSSNLGTMETPYLYMLFPDYGAQLSALVEHSLKQGEIKTIGVVSIQGDILEDARRGVDAALADSTVKVEYFPETPGTTNFTPLATSVKASGADLVVLLMTNGDTAGFLNATRRLGYEPKFVAWPGMADASWLNAYGEISEGMLVANPVANPQSEEPSVATFRKQYMAITGEEPTLFNQIGWVQTMVAAVAIKNAKFPTRECVIGSLNDMSRFDTGLLPPLTFGRDDRQGSTAIEVDQIVKGRLVTVEPFTTKSK